MINLSLPKGSESWYISGLGFIFGPYSPNGEVQETDIVSYRHDTDSLAQGSERFHEKNVSHSKVVGDISYQPILSELTSAPTAEYPYYVNWPCYNIRANGDANISSAFGLVQFGRVIFRKPSSSRSIHTAAVGSLNEFRVYSIDVTTTSPYQAKLSCVRYIRKQPTYSGVVSFHSWTVEKVISGSNAKWRTLNSEFLAFMESQAWVFSATPGTTNSNAYRPRTMSSFSITSLRPVVDSLVSMHLRNVTTSLPGKHYGDLAMEASEKHNAINTNMIAFFRDLRRPQDMIPKLKNLHKLKSISGDYLSLQYGLLPTVSDIKEIFGAFTKVAPYVDRNGFSTYSAVHSESGSEGRILLERTQRIKIAIDNEDSIMQKLANQIESVGMALTLENMWDLIPYSFVIDWFVDVGALLERADTRQRLTRLNIRYATLSDSTVSSLSISKGDTYLPITGTLKVVNYHRWTLDQCPLPPLSLAVKPSPQSHWLEAGALISQRAK